MKFKLFKSEHYDQQKEKHIAYTDAGFNLIKQRQNKNTIVREYQKG